MIGEAKKQYIRSLEIELSNLKRELQVAEELERAAKLEELRPLADKLHAYFCRYVRCHPIHSPRIHNHNPPCDRISWLLKTDKMLEKMEELGNNNWLKVKQEEMNGILDFAIKHKDILRKLETIGFYLK